jgi:cation diffusion facilitator family transporter
VLVADAGHLLADVSALAVSVAAIGIARRRPTAKHTFGFERAEVLAAQVNALLLVGVMAWIVQAAIRRLAAPPSVQAGGMLAVAALALVVNGASAVLLARASGRSLGGCGTDPPYHARAQGRATARAGCRSGNGGAARAPPRDGRSPSAPVEPRL